MNFPEPSFPLSDCALEGVYDPSGVMTALAITGPRERKLTLLNAFQDGQREGQALAEHLARLLILERLRTAELRQQLAAAQRRTVTLASQNARLKAVLASWAQRYNPTRRSRVKGKIRTPFDNSCEPCNTPQR